MVKGRSCKDNDYEIQQLSFSLIVDVKAAEKSESPAPPSTPPLDPTAAPKKHHPVICKKGRCQRYDPSRDRVIKALSMISMAGCNGS